MTIKTKLFCYNSLLLAELLVNLIVELILGVVNIIILARKNVMKIVEIALYLCLKYYHVIIRNRCLVMSILKNSNAWKKFVCIIYFYH